MGFSDSIRCEVHTCGIAGHQQQEGVGNQLITSDVARLQLQHTNSRQQAAHTHDCVTLL